MSIINFRPDDSGVQTLKKDNATAPTMQALHSLGASVRIQPADDHPRTPPVPYQPNYAKAERRKGERRNAQARVILDTRDKRERRREAEDQLSKDDAPKVGIDVFG